MLSAHTSTLSIPSLCFQFIYNSVSADDDCNRLQVLWCCLVPMIVVFFGIIAMFYPTLAFITGTFDWLRTSVSDWQFLVKHLVFVCKLRGKLWSQKLQVVRMRGCHASDLQNIICCHSFHIFIMIFIVIVCIMYKYHLYMCVCVIMKWWTDCQSLMTFKFKACKCASSYNSNKSTN